MLSDETKEAVAALITKMTDNDEMFTAFDVTHVVRNIEDGSAPHHEVKAIVHGAFGDGDMPNSYIRTTSSIDAGGKSVNAFVYHPSWRNSVDYVPARFQDEAGDPFDGVASTGASFISTTNPAPPNAPSSTATAIRADAAGGLGSPTMKDNRGRICVPKKVMKPLGLRHGQRAYVVTHPGHMSVHSADPGNKRILYSVDRTGNIRISKRTSCKAGMVGATKFAVATSPAGVVTVNIF